MTTAVAPRFGATRCDRVGRQLLNRHPEDAAQLLDVEEHDVRVLAGGVVRLAAQLDRDRRARPLRRLQALEPGAVDQRPEVQVAGGGRLGQRRPRRMVAAETRLAVGDDPLVAANHP